MTCKTIIRPVTQDDLEQISDLHANAFGPGRFARTAYRVREGAHVVSPFCLAASRGGVVVGAVRMTEIEIGGKGGALLLGPLVVDPSLKGEGIGRALLSECIEQARYDGYQLILLVGDLAYYERVGFVRVPPGQVALAGPVDPLRLLAAELQPGSLSAAHGDVMARPRQPTD